MTKEKDKAKAKVASKSKAIIIGDMPCKLGPSTNCRTEKHGEDDVPAVDIPLVGLMLDKAQLNNLFGALTWESLYDQQGAGKVPTVLHPEHAPRKLTTKFVGSATLIFGPNQSDVVLDDVTLSKFKAEPTEGGMTAVSLMVQAHENVEKFVAKIIARQNTEISVLLEVGDSVQRAKSKQAELPMSHNAGENKPKDDGADSLAQANALFKSTPGKGRGAAVQ